MVNREVAITDEAEDVFPVATNYTLPNSAASTASFITFKATQFSDSVNRNAVIEEAVDVAAAGTIYGGTYGCSGTIEGAIRNDDATKLLLKSLMGTPAGSTFTLTQTPATVKLMYTDEQADNGAGKTTVYRGVGVSSMELTLNVKEYAKARFSWIGKFAQAATTANINTTITAEPSIFYNATLSFAGTALKCKGITITVDRKFDQDYFYIGSEFLQGLYMNGLTTLGGTITLGAGEWTLLKQTMLGAQTNALDEGKIEFGGTMANSFATGTLVATLKTPNGSAVVCTITAAKCNITNMNRSVQGRNMFDKTVEWQGALASAADFSIVFT